MNRARLANVVGISLLALFVALLGPSRALAVSPGDLDPSFGVQGIALTSFGPGVDRATSMARQADGKFIVGGSHEAWEDASPFPTKYLTLARYNSDGSLDPTFGVNGKVQVNLNRQEFDQPSIWFPSASDLAISPIDGRIYTTNGTYGGPVAVACFAPSGQLDTSFGSQGLLVLDSSPWQCCGPTRPIVAQADGKLLIGETLQTTRATDFALFRINGDGSSDPSFGNSGRVIIDVANGSADSLRCMTLTPDGHILLGGTCQQSDPALVRLTLAGQLDIAFGSGGILVSPPVSLSGIGSLACRPDSGFYALIGGTHVRAFKADGALDPLFGSDGIVALLPFGSMGIAPLRIALQPDGRLLVAGTKDGGYPTYKDVWLTRLMADGSMDIGFGTNGEVVTDFGGADDCAAVGLDAAGRITVAGYALPAAATRGVRPTAAPGGRAGAATGMGMARYQNDASAMMGPQIAFTTNKTVSSSWRLGNPNISANTFDVRYRITTPTGGDGPWVDWIAATSARSSSLKVSPGRTYAFSSRVTDASGLVYAWSSESRVAVASGQSVLKRQGRWKVGRNAKCYLGSFVSSIRAGSILTFTLKGPIRGLAIVATTGPKGGLVAVTTSTRRLGTVSLKSAKTKHRQLIPIGIWPQGLARDASKPVTLRFTVMNWNRPVIIEGIAVCQ